MTKFLKEEDAYTSQVAKGIGDVNNKTHSPHIAERGKKPVKKMLLKGT